MNHNLKWYESKRGSNQLRTIRPFFEVNRYQMGKQIVGTDGKIKCIMCGGRYLEKGIKISFCILFKKNEQTKHLFFNKLKYIELSFTLYSLFQFHFVNIYMLLNTFYLRFTLLFT